MPAVITAWPLGRLRRNSSLSARMRSVVRFMVSLDQEIGVGEGARAAGHGPSSDRGGQGLTGPGFNSATDPACRRTFGCQG